MQKQLEELEQQIRETYSRTDIEDWTWTLVDLRRLSVTSSRRFLITLHEVTYMLQVPGEPLEEYRALIATHIDEHGVQHTTRYSEAR